MLKRKRMALISQRVPSELLRRVDRMAKRTRVLRSDIIRDALEHYLKEESK